MDEKYRLVFRGEILEGQHPAVVKRRLMKLMRLTRPQLDELFSGDPVIVKRNADRHTAAEIQALFKEAGGRLRILTQRSGLDDSTAQTQVTAESAGAGVERVRDGKAAGEASAFRVLTSYVPPPEEPARQIEAPDFGIAAVGARLGEVAAESPVSVPDPDFELADLGVDLLDDRPPPATPALWDVEFEVAEPGATIGLDAGPMVAPVPDISHLRLVER